MPAITGDSVSVGRHNSGRLLSPRQLFDSEHIRLKNPLAAQHYGTDELVGLLEHAAREVARQFPGSRLTIGDMSRHRGGPFRPHRSHRSGRDVDVGFYITSASTGELVYADRFVDFRPDGTTRTNEDWRFDDARNWALVAAMLGQDEVPVQYMFVARWLRERLLAQAARAGAPQVLIDRAALVLDQPSAGGRHEDHFHTRIFCPATDLPRCVDDAPFHEWVPRPSREELEAMREEEARARYRAARERRRTERRTESARERRAARRAARAAAEAPTPSTEPG
jgi:penicillin-insensitive murein endopeptidase